MGQRRGKDRRKKRRKKRGGIDSSGESSSRGGGVMQNLVGGFRRAVGTEAPKQKTWLDYAWTGLLLVAVIAVIYWRFFSN